MRAGDLLSERFRIERHAGAGAMGSVFRAGDLERGGLVAIKVLPPGVSLARFDREVEALARVQHATVVRYVAHGQSAAREAFVAMEWIEGLSLADRLAVSGLSGLETVALAVRLIDGLRALHAHGIVHRDLKPSNVMLPGGRAADARIVDLGIARLPSEADAARGAGAHLGTPRYMAPEQIRDPHAVDGRADVFSLGCVLYECLTCMPAFGGDDAVSVLAQVLFGRAPDPSERRPELPDELERLMERLLTRSRRLRPEANAALQAEFEQYLLPPRRERMIALGAIAPPSVVGRSAHPPAAETAVDGSHERPSLPLMSSRISRLPIAAGAPRGLPARRGPWIGRKHEFARACALLERDRVLTIWGGAGVGKTRLALEVARHFAERLLPPTPLFCELGEAAASADVVRIVSERAGFPVAGHADPELWLGRQLGKLGDVLVVLDRCEHLSPEITPLLQLWAADAPGAMLLATSRTQLHGATELELGPLPTKSWAFGSSSPLTYAGTGLSDAAELVLARVALATGSGAGAAPTDSDDGEPRVPSAEPDSVTLVHAEQIARALDGNPLAIELAAARVPSLGLSGVVARLGAQLALLAADFGHGTMRAAIAWSWQLLDDAQRLVFMQCSVFRGSFTLAAAERVVRAPDAGALPATTAGAPGSSESHSVLALVRALREHSLLVSAPLSGSSATEIRLTMSAALREFAATQLTVAEAQLDALSEVRARHAHYYAELARAWLSRQAASPDAAPSASQRRIEHDNLVAAAEHALAADVPEDAAAILLALEPALLAGGLSSPLASLLERVIAACSGARSLPARASHARLRGLRARLLLPAGELASAERELTAVRGQAEAQSDAALLGTTWLDLGLTHHFARELAEAERCYARALALLSERGDRTGQARCHGNLGALRHDQGQLQEAASGYRHAIALLADAAEPRLLANYTGSLALVLHELGQNDDARELYAAAAAGFEEACDARWLGIVLGNWGMLELACEGGDARAHAQFQRAYALLEGCGDRRSLGLCAGRLAVTHARFGRLQEAERELARAERSLRRDALGPTLGRAFTALVELAPARVSEAAARGAGPAERAPLAHARELHASCVSERLDDRPAREQSDDLRLLLVLIERQLERASLSA